MQSGYRPTCCVVVPVYQACLTLLERSSLCNICQVFSDYPFRVVSPVGLEPIDELDEETRAIVSSVPDFSVCHFPLHFFTSVQAYNRLMTEPLFYSSFSSWDYILLAQLDSWTFSSKLEFWIDQRLSYVGAPWRLFPGLPLGPVWPAEAVGNGGFSLRRVPDFLRVLSSWRFRTWPVITLHELFLAHRPFEPFSSGLCLTSVVKCFNRLRLVVCRAFGWRNTLFFYVQSGLNEDIVFGLLVRRVFRFWVVPSPDIAAHFALDADPDYFYHRYLHAELPLGCHAWEKSYNQFWGSLDTNLPPIFPHKE